MQHILWEGDTTYGHYQVVDTLYDGRPARVLYSGDRQAAQSGVPKDNDPDLLFDYNQRLFELTTSLHPRKILLIGGGVFTLPTALLAALPEASFHVVELDPGLTDVAHRYFDLPISERLTIFNTDGRTFLREHANRYDLIIVDAFRHVTIPRSVKTVQAFKGYYHHLADKGVLAMNIISGYYGPSAQPLEQIYAAALQTFDTIDIFLASHGYSLWLPQNFVLAAQKKQNLLLEDYLLYGTVRPPEVRPDLALEDNDA